jgi:hypothetical protein
VKGNPVYNGIVCRRSSRTEAPTPQVPIDIGRFHTCPCCFLVAIGKENI